MSKNKEIQRIVRRYKDATGVTSVDVDEAVAWAVENMAWPKPTPPDPMKVLARQFAAALREETRTDDETGEPYRANHMYIDPDQRHLWVDIDDAGRDEMQASVTMRREQIVGDVTQLVRDADHWNRMNPAEVAIQVEMDFGMDVELRRIVPAES
ncbi:MAG: hypothetical protein ACRELV_08655 [Longimicrobiales bacterium]